MSETTRFNEPQYVAIHLAGQRKVSPVAKQADTVIDEGPEGHIILLLNEAVVQKIPNKEAAYWEVLPPVKKLKASW